jgi:hypothetical protein
MIEQEKLKNSFTSFTNKWGFSVEDSTFRNWSSTRNDWLWRALYFNKTSTTVTCDRK